MQKSTLITWVWSMPNLMRWAILQAEETSVTRWLQSAVSTYLGPYQEPPDTEFNPLPQSSWIYQTDWALHYSKEALYITWTLAESWRWRVYHWYQSILLWILDILMTSWKPQKQPHASYWILLCVSLLIGGSHTSWFWALCKVEVEARQGLRKIVWGMNSQQ